MEQPQSKSKMTMIIVVIVVIVLLVAGYFIYKSVSSKDTSESSGTDASTIADTATWPTDFVVSIPKYTLGSVSSVQTLANPKTWSIGVTKTTKSNYEKYVTEVKAAGWTEKSNGGTMADYFQLQKEGWQVMIKFQSPDTVQIDMTQVK